MLTEPDLVPVLRAAGRAMRIPAVHIRGVKQGTSQQGGDTSTSAAAEKDSVKMINKEGADYLGIANCRGRRKPTIQEETMVQLLLERTLSDCELAPADQDSLQHLVTWSTSASSNMESVEKFNKEGAGCLEITNCRERKKPTLHEERKSDGVPSPVDLHL